MCLLSIKCVGMSVMLRVCVLCSVCSGDLNLPCCTSLLVGCFKLYEAGVQKNNTINKRKGRIEKDILRQKVPFLEILKDKWDTAALGWGASFPHD